MELREKIANVLYGELSDGPDGEVHPYDERWYRAAEHVLRIPEVAVAVAAQMPDLPNEEVGRRMRNLGHSISTGTVKD